MLNPAPAVYVEGSAVTIALTTRSPLELVVAFPLLGDVLTPCPWAAASNELLVATPEYSRIETRSDAAVVIDTVTVFAAPEIFSA
jgi:hypothetical protein